MTRCSLWKVTCCHGNVVFWKVNRGWSGRDGSLQRNIKEAETSLAEQGCISAHWSQQSTARWVSSKGFVPVLLRKGEAGGSRPRAALQRAVQRWRRGRSRRKAANNRSCNEGALLSPFGHVPLSRSEGPWRADQRGRAAGQQPDQQWGQLRIRLCSTNRSYGTATAVCNLMLQICCKISPSSEAEAKCFCGFLCTALLCTAPPLSCPWCEHKAVPQRSTPRGLCAGQPGFWELAGREQTCQVRGHTYPGEPLKWHCCCFHAFPFTTKVQQGTCYAVIALLCPAMEQRPVPLLV